MPTGRKIAIDLQSELTPLGRRLSEKNSELASFRLRASSNSAPILVNNLDALLSRAARTDLRRWRSSATLLVQL